MTRERRSSHVYLAHAILCIDHATEYSNGSDEGYVGDPKTRDAVLRNLEILGQCLKDAGIAPLESRYPEIRWRRIADFRNVLAHEYIAVDDLLVWAIVRDQLPSVRQALAQYLSTQTQ